MVAPPLVFRANIPDVTQRSKMEVSWLADTVNLFIEGQCIINYNSLTSNGMRRCWVDLAEDRTSDIYGTLTRGCAYNHGFSLVWVYKQTIYVQPVSHRFEAIARRGCSYSVVGHNIELNVISELSNEYDWHLAMRGDIMVRGATYWESRRWWLTCSWKSGTKTFSYSKM